MTAGIPDDMRRTAVVSVAVHVVAVVMLSVVPLVKIPPQGVSAIQVLLVSKAAAPSPPVHIVREPAASIPQAAPVKAHRSEPQQKPVAPAPQPIQRTPLVAKADPPRSVPKESEARPDLAAALRKAEEMLKKPVAVEAAKPAVPPTVPPPTSRATDEVSKLLGQLPAPGTPPQESRPAMALASPGAAAAPRPAALERCPPKARAYCPLLEAAINRVWNADTDPALRRILESAGNSTATVQIVIQPDGEIRSIRLDKSSGNESYDRAVQSLLRELRRVPPLPDDMKGEPFVAITSFTYLKKKDS
jgi:TonB family protein